MVATRPKPRPHSYLPPMCAWCTALAGTGQLLPWCRWAAVWRMIGCLKASAFPRQHRQWGGARHLSQAMRLTHTEKLVKTHQQAARMGSKVAQMTRREDAQMSKAGRQQRRGAS